MERKKLQVRTLDPVHRYVCQLPLDEQTRIAAEITLVAENDPSVRTKQLRGQIRELIVGNHRITYFRIESTLFFVRGFRKKTQKTPIKEIRYAESIYKELTNN